MYKLELKCEQCGRPWTGIEGCSFGVDRITLKLRFAVCAATGVFLCADCFVVNRFGDAIATKVTTGGTHKLCRDCGKYVVTGTEMVCKAHDEPQHEHSDCRQQRIVCRDCYNRNHAFCESRGNRCAVCGEWYLHEHMRKSIYNDKWYCHYHSEVDRSGSALGSDHRRLYFSCETCGEWYMRGYGTSSNCAQHGSYHHDSCFVSHHTECNMYIIRQARYVPSGGFINQYTPDCNPKRFFGFEIEWNGITDLYKEILRLDKNEDFFMMKKDGSLRSDGAEIVSMPCTLDFHRKFPIWREIFDIVETSYGIDDGTGLHIHVSKEDLVRSEQIRFGIFMNRLADQLKPFVRRSANNWCQKYNFENYNNSPIKMLSGRTGRYYVVNYQNSKTMEFRLPKSPYTYEELMTSIELVDAVLEYTKGKRNAVVTENYLLTTKPENIMANFLEWIASEGSYEYIFNTAVHERLIVEESSSNYRKAVILEDIISLNAYLGKQGMPLQYDLVESKSH